MDASNAEQDQRSREEQVREEAEHFASLVRDGITPNLPPEPDLIEAFHAALTDDEREGYYARIRNGWRALQGLPPA